jgi:hypothetical protein
LANYTSTAYLEKALRRTAENQQDTLRPIRGHACLCIASISPGGAERQLCNLAIGLKRRQMHVTVLCFTPAIKQVNSLYLSSLEKEGVDVQIICPPLPSLSPETLIPPLMEDLLPTSAWLCGICLGSSISKFFPSIRLFVGCVPRISFPTLMATIFLAVSPLF